MTTFTPRPTEYYLQQWPWMIVPTYEVSAVRNGLMESPWRENSPHHCDFEDGLRLTLFCSQALPGEPEYLQAVASIKSCSEWNLATLTLGEWIGQIVERLVEVDPIGRPRVPVCGEVNTNGMPTVIFPWHRATEEQAYLEEAQRAGLDPAPFGHLLAQFTIYYQPNDYPKWFVVRRRIMAIGRVVDGGPVILNGGAWLANSIEEARAIVPPGMANIRRMPQDDPKIIEVWT